MDESNHKDARNGKNTFLSRVFGVQADDIELSVRDEEMSNFHMDDEPGSSKLLRFNSAPRDIEDEDPRIPESDQATSSEEDGNSGIDSDNHDNGQNIHGSDSSQAPILMESTAKVGQLSSDEEDMQSVGTDEAEDKVYDEYAPLFAHNKRQPLNAESKTAQNDSRLEDRFGQRSLLFQRILKSQQLKRKPEEMLTNGHNDSKFNHNAQTHPQASFLQNNNPQSSTKTKFPLKKPNLLKNISILNNTPVDKIKTLSPKEKALWKWANVENLDIFLQDVYLYYMGSGIYCIVLQKILNIATLIFVVYISTFMGYCVDYSKIPESSQLKEVLVEQCYANNINGIAKLLLWIFYIFVVLRLVQLYFDIKNLQDIHNFYLHLLNVSDKELETIPWQNIVEQIMYLRGQNALTANVVEVKAKNKIDAHVVANRIMRKENYLIALFNNDILDLRLPFPFYRKSILTKTLEWNINLCIISFAFNESGYLKQTFLKHTQKEYLREELKKRFVLAGVLNIILSPFLVTYFVLLYFFRYFNEYKTSPGTIGARQYTPMAEWKFREYNELYHIFQKRIGLSTAVADKYINQFPNESMNLILRFLTFISGSFVALLGLLTLYDSEHFLNFEITKDKSALFYITILGTMWTVFRKSIADEYNIFDPEDAILELSSYTHYLPKEWQDRYHTEEVKTEFCKLYDLRILILLRELASLILTPFILWFSLPKSADAIIDFFRENSTYVDGLGYVCKYAKFDVDQARKKSIKGALPNAQNSAKHGKNKPNNSAKQDEETGNLNALSETDEESDHAINKMMQSYMYFIDDYENIDNALGKYQLPSQQCDARKLSSSNTSVQNNYSWKKQFQPGQRPELFRIGRHTFRNANSIDHERTQFKSTKHGKHTLNLGADSTSVSNGNNEDESFLNSDLLMNRYSYTNTSTNDSPQKNGVLKLVKEYYKKSDVGR